MGAKTDIGSVSVPEATSVRPPRLGARHLLVCLAGLFALLMLVGCGEVGAAQRKAEAVGAVDEGFARLVLTFPGEIETEIRQSNGIIVIGFKEPLEVDVDRLPASMSGYVSAARRDPDGSAIRLALNRRVTINTMAAGERLFVDLLPDGWTGLPPSLPRDVIEDLARRARDAERRLRQQEQKPAQRAAEPIRVRVASLPTLTRYTFNLREVLGVATNRDRDTYSVVFDRALKFDLADARAALPPTVTGIETETGESNATVRFALGGKAEVRTFREEGGSFVVDVSAQSPNDDAASGQGAMPDTLVPRVPPPSGPSERAPAPQRSSAVKQETPPASPPSAKPPEAKPPAPKTAEAKQDAAQIAAAAASSPQAAALPDRRSAVANEAGAKADHPSTPAMEKAKPVPAAPAASVPATAQPAEMPPPAATAAKSGVAAIAKRQGDALRLIFPFNAATPAAIFRRANTFWMVFDTPGTIDVRRMKLDAGRAVLEASSVRMDNAEVVRVKLDRPQLASAVVDGNAWIVTLSDSVAEPTTPLALERVRMATTATVMVPFTKLYAVHTLSDADSGDRLLVATAEGPARGFLKEQDFVEFRVAQSTHGVVVEPIADDVTAERTSNQLVITRPNGLILTQAANGSSNAPSASGSRAMALDVQSWGFDRQTDFRNRRTVLMTALAEAPEQKRSAARMDVARFYMARDMYSEAKGVLDVVVAGERGNDELARALVLRAISNLMLRRADESLKDLGNPIVGEQHDAALWRAIALGRVGRFGEARDGLKSVDAASAGLPIELQRFALTEAVNCAIEVGDFAEAARKLNDFDGIGVPDEMKATLSVLSGRIAEGLGKINDALSAYTSAAESRVEGPDAATARLRDIELRHTIKQLKGEQAIAELERLTTGWRGDATEVAALQLLARLYTDANQFRDAFQVMRVALTAHPRSPLTRSIQDAAGKTFEAVFLGDRGAALPPVAALGLFYDFRSLTPPGVRGDQMIRRLAERLIDMDLLKQAGELLQHQIEHRLQGAARAQAAARLATVYLMDRKPEKALHALRISRIVDLSDDLRRQRLLLEARALSEVSRHDLALEIVQDMKGREVERLRADIYWNARRWRDAAEQIERFHGDRWREAAPLDATERSDVLRAAIGYALVEDLIGLDRFRQKYMAKMAESSDRRLFEVMTAPPASRGAEFAEAAKSASSVDTLGAFLNDLRERFPDPSDKVSGAPQGARG